MPTERLTKNDHGPKPSSLPGMSLASRIGTTPAGVWLIGHVVSPLQRRLLLATDGRVSLTGKLPVLLLTATGLNVRANPNVSVRIAGVTERHVARDARVEEAEKYWPLFVERWPAYERFFVATHERAIFVLERL